MNFRASVYAIVVIIAAVASASSVAFSGAPGTENGESAEEAVKQRALARWQLLMEGRTESAYEFLSPGYRAAHSLANYSRTIHNNGQWKGAEVWEVKCEAQRCAVKVVLDLSLGGARPVQVPVNEAWIQTDPGGEWWFVPSP